MALSSSGQDIWFSTKKPGFDYPWGRRMKKFLQIALIGLFILGLLTLTIREFSLREKEGQDGVLRTKNPPKNKLGLEEKVGQLFIIGFEGKVISPELENLIKKIHPGGILLLSRNIEDAEQLRNLVAGLQKIATGDTGFPLFVAIDQEGGEISRIPWLLEKTAQSEIKDEESARNVGLERAGELKELGINLNLSPLLDDAASGDFIFARTFQKNPEEAGKLARALISGQKEGGIFTALKHFPGYGGVSFDPELKELPVLAQMPEISQFLEAVQAGPEFLMLSNVVYKDINPNLPFSFSREGIQLLKSFTKTDSLIITDDLSSKVLKDNFGLRDSVVIPFEAGSDMLLVSDRFGSGDTLAAFNFMTESVEKGDISEERVEESLSKIIYLKQKLIE